MSIHRELRLEAIENFGHHMAGDPEPVFSDYSRAEELEPKQNMKTKLEELIEKAGSHFRLPLRASPAQFDNDEATTGNINGGQIDIWLFGDAGREADVDAMSNLIVHAVNILPKLVEVLEYLLENTNPTPDDKSVRATLKEANNPPTP